MWAPCGACDCVGGVSRIPDRWEVPGVLKTSVCPRSLIPADWGEILMVYGQYKTGNLWSAGGVRDQSAIYLDLMDLIATWVNKLNV